MNQIITKTTTRTKEIESQGKWQDFAGLSWIFLDKNSTVFYLAK